MKDWSGEFKNAIDYWLVFENDVVKAEDECVWVGLNQWLDVDKIIQQSVVSIHQSWWKLLSLLIQTETSSPTQHGLHVTQEVHTKAQWAENYSETMVKSINYSNGTLSYSHTCIQYSNRFWTNRFESQNTGTAKESWLKRMLN